MFYTFLKVIFPKINDVLLRSGHIIYKWAIEYFEKRKKQLKKELEKYQSNVNFSFDLWTSLNYKALLGVVAYYIDENGVLQLVS
jgi:hypothetical protein